MWSGKTKLTLAGICLIFVPRYFVALWLCECNFFVIIFFCKAVESKTLQIHPVKDVKYTPDDIHLLSSIQI